MRGRRWNAKTAEREKAERERIAREKAERERAEAEEREKAEQERIRVEQELESQRKEKERKERREQEERDRLDKEERVRQRKEEERQREVERLELERKKKEEEEERKRELERKKELDRQKKEEERIERERKEEEEERQQELDRHKRKKEEEKERKRKQEEEEEEQKQKENELEQKREQEKSDSGEKTEKKSRDRSKEKEAGKEQDKDRDRSKEKDTGKEQDKDKPSRKDSKDRSKKSKDVDDDDSEKLGKEKDKPKSKEKYDAGAARERRESKERELAAAEPVAASDEPKEKSDQAKLIEQQRATFKGYGQVQSCLNKIAPDNIKTIAARIMEAKVTSSDELEVVISLIMKKALTEPHYCETYADLVCQLKGEMPEFPNPDGGKPVSFKSTLLNVCQSEFEHISKDSLDFTDEEIEGMDKDEIDFKRGKKKERCLANMKFIGHLFLRKLLTAKIIGQVIQDLAMCHDAGNNPAEHVLECICTLLNNIGYTLDGMPAGKESIKQMCGRLLDLKQRKTKKSGKAQDVYAKRIQFMIQDLIDTKNAGWVKKSFKAAAKTKEQIREDAKRDEKSQKNDGSEVVVAGQRPAWMEKAAAVDDTGPWESVAKTRR